MSDFADRVPFGVLIYRGETLARIAENLLLVPVEKAILSAP